MESTIKYYNENAELFISGTRNVDFSLTQKMFTDRLA